MNDNKILEGILKIIGNDDLLLEQFAKGLEMDKDEFGKFIDEIDFPVLGRKSLHEVLLKN